MIVIEFLKPWELDASAAFFVAFLLAMGAAFIFVLMFCACEFIADKASVWRHNIRVAFARRCRRSARLMAWLEMEQAETENGRTAAGGLNYGK